MDALQFLKSDHDHLKNLFQRFQENVEFVEKKRIFENIRKELEAHSFAEETVFYPAFKRYDEFQEIIERSLEEHRKVKALLDEIFLSEIQEDQLEEKVSNIIDQVEGHIEEEEGELFPMVRKIMKSPEREQLGRHIEASKQERKLAA